MSIDFMDDLRAEMARAPISPRPDVVREAYHQSRRRKVIRKAALAAGMVVAVAATTLAFALSGEPARPGTADGQHNTTGSQHAARGGQAPGHVTETTAYLISHVAGAVAATGNDIMYTHSVFPGSGPVTGTIQNTWDYGSDAHWVAYTTSGQPQEEDGNGYVHGKLDEIHIDYTQRTYMLGDGMTGQQIPASFGTTPRSCSQIRSEGMLLPTVGATAAQVAADMRQGLSCSNATITWDQHVNGTEAIKIVSQTPDGGMAHPTWLATGTLWISQATFLPIESTTVFGHGQPTTTSQFTYLPATKANLALLLVTIPRGFTLTPS